jgi:hypothetical protein
MTFFIVYLSLSYFLIIRREAYKTEIKIKRSRSMLLLIPQIVIRISAHMGHAIKDVMGDKS